MIRSRSLALLIAAAGSAAGAGLFVPQAAAQFGGFFREGPPRPPSDIPVYRDERLPPRDERLPPRDYPGYDPRRDAPQPPPPPLTRLPPEPGYGRPGGVQSDTLPPPPGSPPAQANVPPGQRPARGAPDSPAQPAPPPPSGEVVVAPSANKIANSTASFSGLDKITGRIISFDVTIDETVQFGALRLTPRACFTRPPTEMPNTDGFIEVDEITLQGEVKRIFTGWMFAASPGLHGVEHPIYDVWLTDCKKDAVVAGATQAGSPAEQTAPSAAPESAPSAAQTPAQSVPLPPTRR